MKHIRYQVLDLHTHSGWTLVFLSDYLIPCFTLPSLSSLQILAENSDVTFLLVLIQHVHVAETAGTAVVEAAAFDVPFLA